MTETTTQRPVRRRTAPQFRNRSGRVNYLIATDECGLAEVQALAATLPLCATGRMFVEVPDADAIGAVDVPPRMTVTWLPRQRGSRRAAAARGELLAGAVRAWSSEMLCQGEAAEVFLEGDYRGVAAAHDYLTESAGVDAAAIHSPERYGLGGRAR